MTRPPLVIVGAGAIGGVIGAHLLRAGDDVRFIDADAAHVAAIRAHGLAIHSADERWRVPAPIQHADDPEAWAEPLEAVLLCVKAQHTSTALQALAPHLAPDGYVASFQNGLCEPLIAAAVGAERTLAAFVNLFADRTAPGEIAYGGEGAVVVGELHGRTTPRLQALVARLQAWGGARASDDVNGFLWSKLAYGAILIATATTHESIADVVADPAWRPTLRALAGEVLALAHRSGVTPQPFDGWDPAAVWVPHGAPPAASDAMFDRMVARLRAFTKTRTGVWRDLAVHRRPTEVPHHYRPVLERAAALGVRAPLLARLVGMIEEIEAGEREQAVDNLAELKDLHEGVGRA